MRTLNALLDLRPIPDLAVICRGCLEFDVALEAVIKDEGMAGDCPYYRLRKEPKK